MSKITKYIKKYVIGVAPVEGAIFTAKQDKEFRVVVARVYDGKVRYIFDRHGCFSWYELTLRKFRFHYRYTGMITRHHRLFNYLYSNIKKGLERG